MKSKLPTILILLVMVLIGAMYWVDVAYYTDHISGFLMRGTIWARYFVLLLPLAMTILGLRTVGPRSVGVMRMQHKGLAVLLMVAAVVGLGLGAAEILVGVNPLNIFRIILGILFLWYAAWIFLAGLQLFKQAAPSPTRGAVLGILAALPYCLLTISRILVNPTSLYRMGPTIRCYAALFVMLWFSMILRAFYVALPRRWVRWLYFLGVFTFLFATCLELPQSIYDMLFRSLPTIDLLESINMAMMGLMAGCISVALAGSGEAVLLAKAGPLDGT